MLTQLFINNIAVIERVSLDINKGFTVLTGETGAGKSIILDAIHAVLGERASRDLVRHGTDRANVTALFTEVDKNVLDIAEEFGIVHEDGSLILSREIRAEGKSVCKINGMPATVSMLKEIGSKLLSIHGQLDTFNLISENVHLEYIDSYANNDALLLEYRNSFNELKSIKKKLDSFESDEQLKLRQIDLLKYQIEEISAAGIVDGEQEELSVRRNIIRNSEKIASAIAQIQNLLAGDEERNGIISDIAQAYDEAENASEFIPALSDLPVKLNDARYLLEDAEELLRSAEVEYDPSELDEIEERLDEIYKLSMKYGNTEKDILEYLEKCEAELHEIEFADEEKERLLQEYEKVKDKSIALARELSKKRVKAAEDFAKSVKEELTYLNMPSTVFYVNTERVPLYISGCDKMQFYVSMNKGEDPKPMSKIASGGEVSRIMLAIKTVLAEKDTMQTLVFDEIDTGISGEAAKKVGLKLKQVSENSQVICITHLAQIAALADTHFLIEKNEQSGRTFTTVKELNREERVGELAKIIGGNEITSLKLDMAREMLEKGVDN